MPVVDQPSPVTTSEQQAVPVAQVTRDDALAFADEAFRNRDITFSHRDVVDMTGALSTFLTRRLPCKSGEGAEAIEAGQVVLEGRGDGTYSEAEQAIRLLIAALTPDATQTREAELVATIEAEISNLKGADSSWAIGIRERLRAALALSPQTLPAPGEVELRKALRNLEAACDDLAANRSSETYRNMVDCDRATPYLLALDDARRDARAILNSSATVAAANDEGVARIIDPAVWDEAEQYRVRADEWFAKGRATPGDCLTDGYREKADAMQAPLLAKAAAIRLLPQGGGKA